MPIFGNDPTSDAEPQVPVDPTADPAVEPVTTDAPDAPSDQTVSAPVDEVVEQTVAQTTSDAPIADQPVADEAPVDPIAPDITVTPVAELPQGQEYPLVITTALGDARFESAEDTATLDPQLAALVAESPLAAVAEDAPAEDASPAEETV